MKDLDYEENILAGGIGFEELKSRSTSEKTKVELKILPTQPSKVCVLGGGDHAYGDQQ